MDRDLERDKAMPNALNELQELSTSNPDGVTACAEWVWKWSYVVGYATVAKELAFKSKRDKSTRVRIIQNGKEEYQLPRVCPKEETPWEIKRELTNEQASGQAEIALATLLNTSDLSELAVWVTRYGKIIGYRKVADMMINKFREVGMGVQ